VFFTGGVSRRTDGLDTVAKERQPARPADMSLFSRSGIQGYEVTCRQKRRNAMSAFFKANESAADRVIRVVLGIVMLALGWGGVVTGGWGWVLKLVGFIPLITGLVGWCGLYKLFGISTGKS
jgi:hypothetical protein